MLQINWDKVHELIVPLPIKGIGWIFGSIQFQQLFFTWCKILHLKTSPVTAKRRWGIIAELIRAGRSAKAVIGVTGYPKYTLYRTITTMKTGGDASRRPHALWSYHKRNPGFLAGFNRSINANRRTPMKTLARDRHVSKNTTHRHLGRTLEWGRITGSVRTFLQIMPRKWDEGNHHQFSISSNIGAETLRVFLDEKKFGLDEVANRQNSRVIVSSPHDVPPMLTNKNSKAVMVFGAFASVKIDVKVKVQRRPCDARDYSSLMGWKSTPRSTWLY